MKDRVEEYDVIVIGSGSGASIVEAYLYQGAKVAQVDRGPLGGTCLNVGCIPSKMLIFAADRVMEVQQSSKLGVQAEVKSIDFGAIMERMRSTVDSTRSHIKEAIGQTKALDFYEEEGRFVDDYTLHVGGKKIRGQKIFIASGARPFIPPIKGIDEVEYLTNESVFQLRQRPESLIIVGGGYIGAEFAHFFAAMGSRVTLVGRNPRLVPDEEPEISELLKQKMAQRMDIRTNAEVVEVKKQEKGYLVIAEEGDSGHREESFAPSASA